MEIEFELNDSFLEEIVILHTLLQDNVDTYAELLGCIKIIDSMGFTDSDRSKDFVIKTNKKPFIVRNQVKQKYDQLVASSEFLKVKEELQFILKKMKDVLK